MGVGGTKMGGVPGLSGGMGVHGVCVLGGGLTVLQTTRALNAMS